MQPDIRSRKPQLIQLALILLVGLVHGLIYIRIMPPWQHYDEPGHFEYAWLLAQRGVRPKAGDFDLEMRRAVAKSMLDQGFFDSLDFRPDLKSTTQPAWIGDYPQFNNPPLYYAVFAFFLRLFPGQGVEDQLYTGRMVSLGFFLLSLLSAWGIARELTPPTNPLRLLLPLTLALLPGFVDLMTAVNNDAAAIAFVCLFLWAGVRLIHSGFCILPLIWLGVIAALCYWTKDTTYLIYPLILLILLFTFLRNSRRWLAWMLVTVSLVVGLVTAIGWGDAAAWYRSTSQLAPSRTSNPHAVAGAHVFQIDTGAKVTPGWVDPLFQPVSALTGVGLTGNTYTLGGWMWASRAVKFRTPALGCMDGQVSKEIDLGIEPTFFAISLTVPGGRFQRVWVNFQGGESASPVTIYYDGLVLAEGERPPDRPPVYMDINATQGDWGNASFKNLLRNASAETAGLRIRPWLDDLGVRFLPDRMRPSIILTYLLDWEGARWLYRASGLRLLRTFWGMFGWGHVPLLGQNPYRGFLIITILGVLVAAGWLILRLRLSRARLPWEALAILGFALAGYWGSAMVRSPVYMSLAYVYLPVARITYPAIIPTLLILGVGWLKVVQSVYWCVSRLLGRIMDLNRTWFQAMPIVTYIVLFVSLDMYSILSIASYYGRT